VSGDPQPSPTEIDARSWPVRGSMYPDNATAPFVSASHPRVPFVVGDDPVGSHRGQRSVAIWPYHDGGSADADATFEGPRCRAVGAQRVARVTAWVGSASHLAGRAEELTVPDDRLA